MDEWTCSCGHKNHSPSYCTACGKARPKVGGLDGIQTGQEDENLVAAEAALADEVPLVLKEDTFTENKKEGAGVVAANRWIFICIVAVAVIVLAAVLLINSTRSQAGEQAEVSTQQTMKYESIPKGFKGVVVGDTVKTIEKKLGVKGQPVGYLNGKRLVQFKDVFIIFDDDKKAVIVMTRPMSTFTEDTMVPNNLGSVAELVERYGGDYESRVFGDTNAFVYGGDRDVQAIYLIGSDGQSILSKIFVAKGVPIEKYIYSRSEAAKKAFGRFQSLIAKQEYKQAYDMLSPAVQAKMGPLDKFADSVGNIDRSYVVFMQLLTQNGPMFSFRYEVEYEVLTEKGKDVQRVYTGTVQLEQLKDDWRITDIQVQHVDE